MMVRFFSLLFLVSLPFFALADEAAPAREVPPVSEKQATLLLLNERLQTLNEEKKAQEKLLLKRGLTDVEKEEIESRLDETMLALEEARGELSTVATGIDLESLKGLEKQKIDLKEEIFTAIEPIIREVKEATSSQQETEQLRQDVRQLTTQSAAAKSAIENLRATLQETTDESLKKTLKEEFEKWEARSLELKTKLSTATYQLEEREKNRPTVYEAVSSTVSDFFRNRGTHLLLAIMASALVVFGLRKIKRLFFRMRPKKERRGMTFTGRLLNLCFIAATFIGGITAFLMVLWLANDWVLLTLALLLLMGIFWAGKSTIPQYFEQAKLMLNLGTVRAGERLNYNGISWQVQRINPYTDLVNPLLDGGLIRLPLRDLYPLHSRPLAEHEIWFPCEKNDWVVLSDGTFGKSVHQTPESVHLVLLGGSRKVIPTAEFLSLHPENLSNNFRVKVTFGVDYALQGISTDQVPQIFENTLKRRLFEKLTKDELLSIKVYFTAAAASSLDYRIVADFHGDLAPRQAVLRDWINSICVDVCNEQGWAIPFTQITVHEAETSEPVLEPPSPRLP